MNFLEISKQIIRDNVYLTMATASGGRGDPWASPVYYAYDDHYNFYWISSPRSQHSVNIGNNDHKIAFVIFDSNAKLASGQGVYLEGKAYELDREEEVAAAIGIYYARRGKPPRPAEDFMGKAPRRMYRAVPEKAWMNTDEKQDDYIIDGRVEIKLR
jgi:nitroimidazol reductase NimA-like FMN-containing flavoprotein (pyridoxamine 5'-phosphate oxidase superfamily)